MRSRRGGQVFLGVALTLAPCLGVAEPAARPHVRDEAGVLGAQVAARLEARLVALAPRTVVTLATRVLPDPERVGDSSKALYDEIVRGAGHYRVLVVVVAYGPDRSRGVIWTGRGPGLWHALANQDVDGVFGPAGTPLTAQRLEAGMSALATAIETHRPDLAVRYPAVGEVIDRLPVAVGLVAGLTAVAVIWRRGQTCPHCGGPLKSRFSISLTWGVRGRVARRTYKCFRCGYSRRTALWPWVADAAPPRRPRGEGGRVAGS